MMFQVKGGLKKNKRQIPSLTDLLDLRPPSYNTFKMAQVPGVDDYNDEHDEDLEDNDTHDDENLEDDDDGPGGGGEPSRCVRENRLWSWTQL